MNKVETSIHPHKIYHVNLHPIPMWKWGLWLIFLLITNGGLFLSVLIFYWNVSSQYGPALGFTYSLNLILISFLVFCVSIILTVISLKKSKQYLTIYKEGIVVRHSKPLKIPWKSVKSMEIFRIEHYFLWLCVKKAWKFRILLTNGKKIQFYIPSDIPEKIIMATQAAFDSTQTSPNAME